MTNPNFQPTLSTNEIWRDLDSTRCLTDDLDAIEADIDALQSDVDSLDDVYATVNHTHTGYATSSEIDALEDAVASKADATHTHTEYATSSHTHDGYATTSALNALEDAIDGKADATHTHTDYVSANEIDALESAIAGKANAAHTHTDYASITHSHSEYATTNALSELSSTLDGKSDSSHTHDDRYYTESEIDAKLNNKSDSTHTHIIDTSLSSTSENPVQNNIINAALDSKVPSSRTVNGKALSSDITLTASDVGADASGTAASQAASALASAKEYADDIKDDLLNGAGTAYDTLKELGDLIDVNADAIDALETVAAGKANASDLTSHTSNTSNPHSVTLTQLGVTATAAEVNYLDGVTSNVQNQLNNKSANGHTHSYAASSSAGGAATSANKLNTNAGSATNPVYFANGIPVATTHTIAKSVPADAVFTDTTYGVATTGTAGLMSASDKEKLDGIATGANNYTYTLPTASSTLGGVKTTSTVTSSSGYTACPIISGVPYYKDTNTTYDLSSFGVTATASELNKLDGCTATVTELNYVDGVTSNIQTQLNGKAESSHTHDYLPLSGGTISGDTNVAGILRVQGQQAFYYNTGASYQTIGTNNATGGTTICCGSSANTTVNGATLLTASIAPRDTGSYSIGDSSNRYYSTYLRVSPNVSSDERLKKNIANIDNDVLADFVNKLNVVSYNYKDDEENANAKIGLIAQDVQKADENIAKYIIEEDDNGYYSLRPSDLVFPLIATIQKLTKEVEDLKAQLA